MNPEFASRMRKILPRAILAILLVVLAAMCWKIVYGGGIHIPPFITPHTSVVPLDLPVRPDEPVEEWVVVDGDNVLFWPTVNGECQSKNALMQVHSGEKALVLSVQGNYVEVALNNLALPHTRGCIHGSLLVPDNES